jgi:hypothetical protein
LLKEALHASIAVQLFLLFLVLHLGLQLVPVYHLRDMVNSQQ